MTNSIIKSSKLKGLLIKTVIILFWLAIWQLIYMILSKEILLVSPISVFKRIIELSQTKNFWLTIIFSVSRIMFGFFLGIIFGIIIGLISNKIKLIYELIYPIISIIRATPVASFIILALVFMKNDGITTFIVVIMVIPMSFEQTILAIKSIDKKLIEMLKVFKVPLKQKIKLLIIPSSKPYFVALLSMSLGFSWKAGIAAEVLALPDMSIGYAIYDAKIYLETVDLFAWTAVVITLSMIIEKLLLSIFERGRK